ncbi:non-homologous end-joining DNA ligase [Capillimicrobium parvum]|uniref:DNA ligase (ATP) n=1 Tax=Capillimicrobium parvum TaxID=2884022 RepID=A0A9E6XVP2_9ACTN|nr:non-homologous end-joining DNA ligase [Capillimicrobium parvum]UGS35304.1 Multifunctional non-homologous end joining protein LigD [Capillimicrobium parvum]
MPSAAADPFAALSDDERMRLRPEPLPERVSLMKAVLTDDRFSDPAWVYERKLDGIRCAAIRGTAGVRLLSRNDLNLNGRFPEVAAALEADGGSDVVLDGEVVALAGGQTSFERLQQRGERPVAVYYYVFDLLHLAGQDVTALGLRARKSLLRHAVTYSGPIRLTAHRNRDGEAMYAEACRKGWEGVIAKRADAPYTHGRSRDWLKFKCSAEQELVIGGYTAPKGSRTDLGALLVGHFEEGRLRYAGKVGTGFTRETLRDLAGRLEPLRRDGSPFADEVKERHVTWVEPRLVAEIGFSEWTRDGRLRHPRFLGLRDDKPAEQVVRERPGTVQPG